MSRADIFKRKEREVTADSIVKDSVNAADALNNIYGCLLYTSPSPRDS